MYGENIPFPRDLRHALALAKAYVDKKLGADSGGGLPVYELKQRLRDEDYVNGGITLTNEEDIAFFNTQAALGIPVLLKFEYPEGYPCGFLFQYSYEDNHMFVCLIGTRMYIFGQHPETGEWGFMAYETA